MKIKNSKYIFYSLCLTLTCLILDQYSKYYITTYFDKNLQPIVINDYLRIVFTLNRGVSFGLFKNIENAPFILTIITCVVSFLVFAWLIVSKNKYQSLMLGIVLGGGLGNIIDRITIGAVVDFIQVHYNNLAFPSFNLADSFISIGIVIIVFWLDKEKIIIKLK